jgi:copper chaperone CopZ
MKTPKQIAFPVIILLLFISSCTGNANRKIQKDTIAEPTSVEISIKGMTCTGCEQTIQAAVSSLDGIQSVQASYTEGKAVVVFDKTLTDSVKIKEMINGKGYAVTKVTEVPPINVKN